MPSCQLSARQLCGVVATLLAVCGPTFGQSPASARADRGTKTAIVVGLNEFDDPGLTKLEYPEQDASDVAAQLESDWNVIRVLPGTAQAPERASEVLAVVRAVAEDAGSGDSILVYLSGHGFDQDGKSYFCVRSTSSDALVTSGLSLEAVQDVLTASRAAHRILIVDACRNVLDAGARRGNVEAASAALSEKERWARLDREASASGGAAGTGRPVFTCYSTSPGVVSREPDRGDTDSFGRPINHSVFTHFLLQGMKGHADTDTDGSISVQELAAFAAQRTTEHTKKGQVPHIEPSSSSGNAAIRAASKYARQLEDQLDTLPETIELELAEGGAPVSSMVLVRGRPLFVMGGRGVEQERREFERYGFDRFLTTVKPVRVSIDSFYLDQTEVSVAQFGAFLAASNGYRENANWPAGATGNATRQNGLTQKIRGLAPTLPMTGVTWAECRAYAAWAGKRLPRLAEWEYAVRGPSYRACSWSPGRDKSENSTILTEVNVRFFGLNAAEMAGLDAVAPSADRTPEGILNLCSNAREWTNSRLDSSRFAVAGASFDHRNSSFWNCEARAPDYSSPAVGFRCAVDATVVLELTNGESTGRLLLKSEDRK